MELTVSVLIAGRFEHVICGGLFASLLSAYNAAKRALKGVDVGGEYGETCYCLA